MRTTLKDVAMEAGVSYATVSRALAGKPNIRRETVARVMHAARALDYRPNRTARSLQARHTQVIGVIVSDIRYDLFPPIVRAIEDHAAAEDYAVMLYNSDEDPDKEARAVDLLREENVAGVIIVPTGRDSRSLRTLQDARVPLVLLDRTVPNVEADAVVIDNYAAARHATTHLLANGFTRIAAIMGPTDMITAQERFAGFRAAVEAGGHVVDFRRVHRGPPNLETGQRAMEALLSDAHDLDAVFVSNHQLAGGALKALVAARRGDLGFLTFDDPPWASFVTPTVTTVAPPAYDMGVHAIRLLLDQMQGLRDAPKRHVLQAPLHVRESTRSKNARLTRTRV